MNGSSSGFSMDSLVLHTSSESCVDAIGKKANGHGNPRHKSGGRRQNSSQHQRNKAPRNFQAAEKCGRCGRECHSREKCPAKDSQCVLNASAHDTTVQCVTIKLSQWLNKIKKTTWILHFWTQCQIAIRVCGVPRLTSMEK